METTNYAYITKLVKICDQLLGTCRPSNLSAVAGNMEPCSMSCHGLVTDASADILLFF